MPKGHFCFIGHFDIIFIKKLLYDECILYSLVLRWTLVLEVLASSSFDSWRNGGPKGLEFLRGHEGSHGGLLEFVLGMELLHRACPVPRL